MSEGGSEPGVAKKTLRTVTPPYFGRPDAEMNAVGWIYFFGLAILLIPMLPFILALWVADVIARSLARRRERREEQQREQLVAR